MSRGSRSRISAITPRSISRLFDHGAFQAMSFGDGVSDGVGEHTIGPAPAEDVSRAFTAAGHPLAIVDLRTAPAGVVADWLAAPHPTRSIGSTFVSEATMASDESLARSYDAVIFVETTTRARPLPAGLRPSKVGMTPAPAP